jgi:hypothetical protein
MNLRAASIIGILVVAGAGFFALMQWMSQSGTTTLLDGTNFDNFDQAGNANWRVGPGEQNGGSTVYADLGNGFLVTKQSYDDFRLRAEFWADEPANSGIFIRCDNPQQPGANSCYEVNIFDTRPDPTYATGAIVNVPGATVDPVPKAANKWNVMEVEASGPQLTVRLNGEQTVSVEDSEHARGRIALQRGAGKIMWRKVEIQEF